MMTYEQAYNVMTKYLNMGCFSGELKEAMETAQGVLSNMRPPNSYGFQNRQKNTAVDERPSECYGCKRVFVFSDGTSCWESERCMRGRFSYH